MPARSELAQICAELEDAYRDRFATLGLDFNTWANQTTVAAEVNWSHKRAGRMWGATAKYAGRRGWRRTLVVLRPVSDAVADVRSQLDELLIEKPWGRRG